MEIIIQTKNKQEAESLMNINKYEAAIEGIRNLISYIDNDRIPESSILYRGKLVSVDKLDKTKITDKERYLPAETISHLLEDIISDIPER